MVMVVVAAGDWPKLGLLLVALLLLVGGLLWVVLSCVCS